MNPDMQQRLITVAKAVALVGVLVALFLWLISMASNTPTQSGAASMNNVTLAAGEPTAPQTPPPADATPAATAEGPANVAAAPAPAATTPTSANTVKDPGDEYYRMGLYPEALKYWTAEADKGDAHAAYRLGVEYLDGKSNVVERDFVSARKYYEIAANKGDARAQLDLGTIYESGHGTPASLEKAAEWYLKSAERGHPQAQWNIATMMERGEGIAKDDVEALKWFYLAADQGFRGVPVSDAGLLDQSAPFATEEVEKRLTREQVEEARRRALDFKPQSN